MTLLCLRLHSSKGIYKFPKAKSDQSGPNPSYTISPTANTGASNATKQDSSEPQATRRPAEFGGRVSVNEFGETPRYSKDDTSRRLIEEGILSNDFLKNLDKTQVKAVVDSMVLREVDGNKLLITEGDVGSHMYVAAEGAFEVIKGGKTLRRIEIGEVFGELALLYNAKRQASIKVLEKSKVWELERKIFQLIMVKTGMKQTEDNVRFLRSVPLFKDIDVKILSKISDLLKVEFFPTDKCIVRQGDSGDTFYIIKGGSVKITKKQAGSDEEEDIGVLQSGGFFGERALLSNDKRQATVTARSPGVECLVLDRAPFEEFLGPIGTWNDKTIDERTSVISEAPIEYADVKLQELDYVATLGVGGFGRVELVTIRKERNTFALKCLKKVHVVQQQQEQHVYNEKKVMLECRNCPFINKLFRTFKDNKYVYFLMEPCLGGDLFTILQKNHLFNEQTSRFMTGCVIEAFAFLHARNIVYRDLKPENVMLDNRGYLKVIDFGFAKKISPTSKTWTFAGTPEYVAPEIILGKGHDRAADYWTLGIFLHELLVGKPPFRGTDHMRTYNQILKGIEAVHFPKHVSKPASRLIRRLCRAVPTERLGYQRNGIQDIRDEPWFSGFRWDALVKGTMKAPISITVNGPSDTRYFDRYPKNKEIPPDELSGWDKDF